MSYNQAVLHGNVGKDPEMHTLQSGKKVASFSIATNEKWTDKATGEKKENVEWHNIKVFNTHLAEKVVGPYVKKGQTIMVVGKIKTRKYTDKSGNERQATEIVIDDFFGTVSLGGRNDGGGGRPDEHSYGTTKSSSSGAASQGSSKPAVRDLDDEVPF